ncbi:MAG: cyclic nucleotide-binding domain-containing protein [Caldithrix sp.]|nr:cyclic nucleotide-binding domain-containing protein [Caldithrix sp.]
MDKQDHYLYQLIEDYFSDDRRVINLQAGQRLMKQGDYNDRLYLVRSGRMKGYVEHDDGQRIEILDVGPNFFIGVYSFFSKTYRSSATVEAETDCQVAYIGSDYGRTNPSENDCMEKIFMPVVVTDLLERQRRLQEVNREKEQALKKLIENEKMASLGQMASGIAHEINNSISVLARNSHWLVEKISSRLVDEKYGPIFEAGLMRGRFFSSKEIRNRRKEIVRDHGLDDTNAAYLAQTGLRDADLNRASHDLQKEAQGIYQAWELGATFHDMLAASDQTTHVVKSIRAMGAQNQKRSPGLDINESIRNAMSLLRHRITNLQVDLDLQDLPYLTGNMGEFVQIWTNLIKNAYEAVCHFKDRQPRLSIHSIFDDKHLVITLSDNGPGIPDEVKDKIFQPNVTTKVSGLSFGLGLGLTIVQRVITDYNGIIEVDSSPEKGTTFKIKIPHGGNHGKT